MDLIQLSRKHQVEIDNFRTWLPGQSNSINRSSILPPGPGQCQENVKFNCADCGVILTSESQAQEHFSGKKHQNSLKNKTHFSPFSNVQIRMSAQISTNSNNSLLNRRLQSSCYTRKNAFDINSRLKSNLQEIIPPPAGRDNILETVIKSRGCSSSSSDLSIYRTPSGKYYCQSCNLTVNSQAQFLQHSESRKHKHKIGRSCKMKF